MGGKGIPGCFRRAECGLESSHGLSSLLDCNGKLEPDQGRHALFLENSRLQLLPPKPKELLSAWVIASSWFAKR